MIKGVLKHGSIIEKSGGGTYLLSVELCPS